MLKLFRCEVGSVILTLMTIFATTGVANKAQIDSNNYALLIKDVKEYFTASGVFLLRNDDLDDSEGLTELMKRLSILGISSQSISYSTLDQINERNHQSLTVVFLSSITDLTNFRLSSQIRNISFGFYLIIFLDGEINQLCHEPEDNMFHLEYHSQVVIKCEGGDDDDDDDDDRLRKWYSLEENRTDVLDLAGWNARLGLYDRNLRYFDERYQLFGKTLKVGTVKFFDESSGIYRKNSRLAMYFADVLEELEKCMNFSVVREKEEDEVSRWTNLINSVVENKTDMVVAPITVSKLRLEIIDFSKPMLFSSNRIYLRQPDGVRVQWSSYFRAFTLTSWSLIALLLITVSLMTASINALINDTAFSHFSVHYVLENFINVWGIYCQQGMSEVPSATPLRMAYFSALLLTLIVWAIYSASITSYLTVQLPSLPFSNIDGLVKDGSYKIIVVQNSSDQETIMEGSDPTLTKLRPLLKKVQDLPTRPFVAFEQVCNERTGFYASEAVLNDVGDFVPCRLTYIETGQFECLAMVLPTNSPYISSINFNLQRLEDSGVLKRLKNWYFQRKVNPPETSHSAVSLWGVVPLLVIYASGFGLSVIVFGLEYIFGRRTGRLASPINVDDSLSA